MKRIISLLLAFVLVLSFSVTVFAVDDTWYGMVTDYLYRIDYKIGVGNGDLSNISSYTISIYSLLSAHLQSIDESLADSASYLEDIKTYTYNADYYLEQLYTVLADKEDLALKESQKDNQQFIQDNFFTPGSDLSVDTNKLGALVSYSDSFNTFFNFSSYGNSSPLDQLGEGSPFSQWFTEENGKSMDPTFSAGGGGSDPDPDDPNPDDPDPEPETTATPTLSYNESTFTVSASGNGTVIMYVDGSQVSNPYTFIQTESTVTYVVTATAQEEGKLISNTARLDVTIEGKVVEPDPEPEPEVTTMPSISYNEPTFTVSASGNGTVIMYVDGVQVSNPYTFTQGDSAVTYVVTATAQEEGKLISNTARLEVTVPKYEPPFSVTNLIPTSKAGYSSNSIYNGTGYRTGYVWTSGGTASSTSISGWGSTGWIDTTSGDVFYIYNAEPYRTKSYTFAMLYNGSGLITEVYTLYGDNSLTPDSNGVITWTQDHTGFTRIAFNLMNLSPGSIITKNEYPIQVSASAYSLRGGGSYNPGSNIVTSFYNSRQSVFEYLLKGRWFK